MSGQCRITRCDKGSVAPSFTSQPVPVARPNDLSPMILHADLAVRDLYFLRLELSI